MISFPFSSSPSESGKVLVRCTDRRRAKISPAWFARTIGHAIQVHYALQLTDRAVALGRDPNPLCRVRMLPCRGAAPIAVDAGSPVLGDLLLDRLTPIRFAHALRWGQLRQDLVEGSPNTTQALRLNAD